MTDQTQIQRFRAIANDPLATDKEIAAAIESLKDLTMTGSVASRKRATDALDEVFEPAESLSIVEEPEVSPAEKFLLAQKLDRLCERYLAECGDKTFLDSRAGISGWWVNLEWQRDPDRAALERKLARLRKMRIAALRVRDCWTSVLHDHDSEVDPAICALLGIDLSADAGEKLSKAQAAYIALAAEGRVADE
jgi:hypothetical protein